MPFLGEIVRLTNQLWDGDTGKFVRAIVRKTDGTEVTGSPFTLAHIGNGKYTNNTLLMPNEDRLDVTYETYDDAGFTTLSEDHTISTDVYRLEIPDSTILAKLDQILNIVSTFNIPGSAIRVRIGGEGFTGELGERDALVAALGKVGVDAMVRSDGSVEAKTGTVGIEAEVKSCD